MTTMQFTPEQAFLISLFNIQDNVTQNLNDDQRLLIDWETLLELAIEKKMWPAVRKALSNETTPITERLNQLYEDNQAKIDVRLKELIRIGKMLDEHGVPYCCVKGFILSSQIYGTRYDRKYGDIDLVILDESQLSKVAEYMLQLGYKSLYKDKNINEYIKQTNIEIPEFELYHEIPFYSDDNDVCVEIKVSTSALNVQQFRQLSYTLIDFNVNGYIVKTFDTNHMLIHMLANSFVNSEIYCNAVYNGISLRDYYDLFYYIKNNNVDWNIIHKYTEKYDMLYQAKRVLENLIQITPAVTRSIIEMFASNQLSESNWYYLRYYTFLKNIDWPFTFLERLFAPKKQIEGYHRQFEKHWFVESQFHELVSISHININELEQLPWIKFDPQCRSNIKYGFFKHGNNYYLAVNIDKEFNYENYYFRIRCLLEDEEIKQFVKHFRYYNYNVYKSGIKIISNFYIYNVDHVFSGAACNKKMYYRLDLLEKSKNPDEALVNGLSVGFCEGVWMC